MTLKAKPCSLHPSSHHTTMMCPTKKRKPLNKRGKVTKKWLKTRDRWLEVNKAPYYFCFYCNKMLTRTTLTLDHYKSRSRNPELRYVWRNLVPCCYSCNAAKGSMSGDEYLEKIRKDK